VILTSATHNNMIIIRKETSLQKGEKKLRPIWRIVYQESTPLVSFETRRTRTKKSENEKKPISDSSKDKKTTSVYLGLIW